MRKHFLIVSVTLLSSSPPFPIPAAAGQFAPVASTCDAGKIGCVAKRYACLLKVHATAEKNGAAPDAAKLQKCHDAFDGGAKGPSQGCIGKLEGKQSLAKPKTLCSVSDQLEALEGIVDTFVDGVVTAIDPGFPTVGPASTCDAGKKLCVAKRASCLLNVIGAAIKTGGLADPAKVEKCADQFDGGDEGFAKGCLGKLEGKQKPAKPHTLCAVTGDLAVLAGAVDHFAEDAVKAIRDSD